MKDVLVELLMKWVMEHGTDWEDTEAEWVKVTTEYKRTWHQRCPESRFSWGWSIRVSDIASFRICDHKNLWDFSYSLRKFRIGQGGLDLIKQG